MEQEIRAPKGTARGDFGLIFVVVDRLKLCLHTSKINWSHFNFPTTARANSFALPLLLPPLHQVLSVVGTLDGVGSGGGALLLRLSGGA